MVRGLEKNYPIKTLTKRFLKQCEFAVSALASLALASLALADLGLAMMVSVNIALANLTSAHVAVANPSLTIQL